MSTRSKRSFASLGCEIIDVENLELPFSFESKKAKVEEDGAPIKQAAAPPEEDVERMVRAIVDDLNDAANKLEQESRQKLVKAHTEQIKAAVFAAAIESKLQMIDDHHADLLARCAKVEKETADLLKSREPVYEKTPPSTSTVPVNSASLVRWSATGEVQTGCSCNNTSCGNRKTVTKEVILSSRQSLNLEAVYQDYLRQGASLAQVTLDLDSKNPYLYDFAQMERISPRSKEVLRLNRVVHTASTLPCDVQSMAETFSSSVSLHAALRMPVAAPYAMTEVPEGEDEDIAKFFLDTMAAGGKIWKVTKMHRIAHPRQAQLYQAKRTKMAANPNELLLFHACRNNGVSFKDIVSGGLDMRCSAQGQTGRAVYMADNAWFSHLTYGGGVTGVCQMYIVRCLAGNIHRVGGNGCLTTILAPKGFDSVWHVQAPTEVYAVYDNAQTYITHMIEYEEV